MGERVTAFSEGDTNGENHVNLGPLATIFTVTWGFLREDEANKENSWAER